MEIIESFIQSKTGDLQHCEDDYFVNDSFAVVIDGATSVSGKYYDGLTQGQLATKTIKDAFQDFKGKESLEEILDLINERFGLMHERIGIQNQVREVPHFRPTASVIIYSHYHRKIWFIGDCMCFFDGQVYQHNKHIDDVFAEARSIVMKGELVGGKSIEELQSQDDIGFSLIRPLIQKQYYFQNQDPIHDLSFPVINGFTVPLELVKTVDVPASVNQLSLASDGYPTIFDSLEETEDYLKDIVNKDPLCINENMSTKGISRGFVSFDDRTYIKVNL